MAAFELIETVPNTYKGTAEAAKAETLLNQLRQDKTVAAELRAKPSLDKIKGMEKTLSGKPGSFNPMLRRFQRDNAELLAELKEAIEKMKTLHGKTKAFENAVAIGKRYGVDVK